MNKHLFQLATVMLASMSAQGGPVPLDASKEAKAVTPLQAEAWGSPILGGGVKSNSEFTEGSLFLVQPLWDTIGDGSTMEGSVFFVEPYGTWGEGGDFGGSLGLGFRHLFSDQTVADARSSVVAGLLTEGIFVGGNVFLDYAQTEFENDFWQLGVGLEAGTRYLEARANYYFPLSDDQVISRRTETETTTSTKTTTKSTPGATSVVGGQIVQDINTQSTKQVTTRTTTRTFELFEEPLEGWDLELALLVPGIDRYCDVKLIAGYYNFEGDRSTQKISGWRTGVEIRPVPAVVFHATWYEGEELYKDDWIAGVRLEIPLGQGLKEAFTPRRRHLAERLFEPVRRKNSSITTGGTEEQATTSSTSSTGFSVITNTSTQIIIGPASSPVKPPV